MSQVEPKPGEELVYVEGLQKMLDDGLPVYATEIKDGRYYDCGNKLEYLKTNIELALQSSDFKQELKEYLKNLELN